MRSRWRSARSVPTSPGKDLQLGKDLGREPFRTMGEIKRRIKRGGLDQQEQGRLWECLYLTGGEVVNPLNYVRDHAPPRFISPMLCFFAFTGARRSEICR